MSDETNVIVLNLLRCALEDSDAQAKFSEATMIKTDRAFRNARDAYLTNTQHSENLRKAIAKFEAETTK